MAYWHRLLMFLWRPLSTGTRGERLAARHLRQAGYRILARNLRGRVGEIDILAQAPDGRTIVVVEVKTAARSVVPNTSLPESRVHSAKQHKLTVLAAQVVRQYRLSDRPVRFDVIGVSLPPRGPAALRHHIGAFASFV